jgi:hypothetical protein
VRRAEGEGTSELDAIPGELDVHHRSCERCLKSGELKFGNTLGVALPVHSQGSRTRPTAENSATGMRRSRFCIAAH